MTAARCFGILLTEDCLIASAPGARGAPVVARFPANAMGVQALRLALADCPERLRIAISGVNAIEVALALDGDARREILIVGSAIDADAAGLMKYARRVY